MAITNYFNWFAFPYRAISIYMDTLNIFIRIVSILAGQGNRRRWSGSKFHRHKTTDKCNECFCFTEFQQMCIFMVMNKWIKANLNWMYLIFPSSDFADYSGYLTFLQNMTLVFLIQYSPIFVRSIKSFRCRCNNGFK